LVNTSIAPKNKEPDDPNDGVSSTSSEDFTSDSDDEESNLINKKINELDIKDDKLETKAVLRKVNVRYCIY
jgi:hypothetical protein